MDLEGRWGGLEGVEGREIKIKIHYMRKGYIFNRGKMEKTDHIIQRMNLQDLNFLLYENFCLFVFMFFEIGRQIFCQQVD